MIKRNTKQKRLILQTLSCMCHPSATMVYERLRETDPKISRATVFRVLGDLAEDGVLRRIKLPGVDDRYDLVRTPHQHIRCRVCGRIDDITLDRLPDPNEACSDTHGYRIEGYEICVSGVCPVCADRERGEQ